MDRIRIRDNQKEFGGPVRSRAKVKARVIYFDKTHTMDFY